MPVYKAPVEDVVFLLNDVFPIERYNNLPGFADATPDVVEAILNEGAKLCEEVLRAAEPVGRPGGLHAATPDGSVTTPKGFKEAYERLSRQGGWMGLSMPEEYGGQGLPYDAQRVMHEFLVLGEPRASRMYPGLTQGAIAALLVHGSRGAEADLPAEDDRGRLDRHHEPHRAALRHRSRPDQDQGRAERRRLLRDHRHQDLHLGRRARPDREHRPPRPRPHRGRAGRAPRASRSSSCRRFSSAADGSLGERNGVSCGSLEHKMGIHGNATCVMNYDGATGWLVGEENRGLNAMFVMMNEARLGGRRPGPGAVRGRLPERRRPTRRTASRAAR